MDVKWLKRALKNLDAEATYIAKDSVTSAQQVVSKIYHSVELLKKFPSLGRPGRIHGTRELIIPDLPYIIPYRVQHECVEVLRVFHTSRKWKGK